MPAMRSWPFMAAHNGQAGPSRQGPGSRALRRGNRGKSRHCPDPRLGAATESREHPAPTRSGTAPDIPQRARFACTVNAVLTDSAAFSGSFMTMPSERAMRVLLAILSVAAILATLAPAQAEKRIFIIANNADDYGVDRCLANGSACGTAAATTYCQTHAFNKAVSFRK